MIGLVRGADQGVAAPGDEKTMPTVRGDGTDHGIVLDERFGDDVNSFGSLERAIAGLPPGHGEHAVSPGAGAIDGDCRVDLMDHVVDSVFHRHALHAPVFFVEKKSDNLGIVGDFGPMNHRGFDEGQGQAFRENVQAVIKQ